MFLYSHTYFLNPAEADKKKLKLECTLNNQQIESIIPGDFDGDGGMDIFVVVKSDEDTDETVSEKKFWPFSRCFFCLNYKAT